jgi:hypothetical protein
MQTKEEIEREYGTQDPWGYQQNPDDLLRKRILTSLSEIFGPYQRCLDLGAGEGWITQDYCAVQAHGYELSDAAAGRFPPRVLRVHDPVGDYDLVCATGVMYGHYDWKRFMQLIRQHASQHVLVSSIKDWEVPDVNGIGHEIFRCEFPYREYHQLTRVFEVRR